MNDRSPPALEEAAPEGRQKPRRRRRGNEAATMPVRVEIDLATGGGYHRNRYDVEVRGRVVSTEPVEAADLLFGEAVVGRVEYGATDAIAETLLNGRPARQVAFHFDWPIARDEAAQRTTCAIAVRM